MPDEAATHPKRKLVCVGKVHANKEVCLMFRLVASDDTLGDERIYAHKHLKQVRVGNVYEVEIDRDDPTRIYTNTIRWLCVWKDQTEAATWQAVAAAFDTLELAKKSEKKETGRRLPLELLRPLREEYRRTNPAGRLAIEVRVLAYLRLVSLQPEH
jgi:hypothetical protein